MNTLTKPKTAELSSFLGQTKFPLRKQAYSNILDIFYHQKWKFSDKNSDIFQISAQNIDCG